jgi:hypothetical protein
MKKFDVADLVLIDNYINDLIAAGINVPLAVRAAVNRLEVKVRTK